MWPLVTCIVTLLGAILYWLHRRWYSFADHWPTLEGAYPLIGNAWVMIGKNDVERFDAALEIFRRNVPMQKVWAGPKLVLLCCHPDLAHQILSNSNCLEKPWFYRFLGFEHGLLTSKEEVWRDLRKRLNPCFHIKIIHGFLPILARCGQQMARRLNEQPDGTTLDIYRYTSLCVLEMVCGTALGSDVLDRDKQKKDLLAHSIDRDFALAAKRMTALHLHVDFVYRKSEICQQLEASQNLTVNFLIDIIKERREYLEKHPPDEKGSDDFEGQEYFKKPKIFVDQLLMGSSDGKPFTDREIIDNLYAIITGAVETSSLLTAHACLVLSFYPEIQQRLFDEINQYFPADSPHADFSPETFRRLRYTEMFLNEVQRVYPVAPFVARENSSEIEVDGVKVPPGNIFGIAIYMLHRHPDFWGPNAEQFDPENFSEERVNRRSPNAFIPFGSGRRNCIALQYAPFAVKIMLINLVRNFKFSSKITPETMKFRIHLALALATEHWVQIEKRNPVGWA
ncbi:probable cytochrome P450 313a4 [Uranotaenia lowii]|uniref:probable cytochrome P450 313a4 n=1 Tax=Uranotaenia lowii TaxID=190385 RepID=UPI00247B0945|nr:probable cytochrome P450 313a4 [Uranotaenia lowii]